MIKKAPVVQTRAAMAEALLEEAIADINGTMKGRVLPTPLASDPGSSSPNLDPLCA